MYYSYIVCLAMAGKIDSCREMLLSFVVRLCLFTFAAPGSSVAPSTMFVLICKIRYYVRRKTPRPSSISRVTGFFREAPSHVAICVMSCRVDQGLPL